MQMVEYEAFTLSVAVAVSGACLNISTDSSETIGAVAARLLIELEVPYPEFSEAQIFVGSEVLRSEETLSTAGLGRGSEVQAVVKTSTEAAVKSFCKWCDRPRTHEELNRTADFLSQHDLDAGQYEALVNAFVDAVETRDTDSCAALAKALAMMCRDPALYLPRLFSKLEPNATHRNLPLGLFCALSEIDKEHQGALAGIPKRFLDLAARRLENLVDPYSIPKSFVLALIHILGQYGDTSAIPSLKSIEHIPAYTKAARAAIAAIESRALGTLAAADHSAEQEREAAIERTTIEAAAVGASQAEKQNRVIHEAQQRLVALRVNPRTERVLNAVLEAEELKAERKKVEDAGYEILPDWANGAILLAPVSEEAVREAGWNLRPHHIVVAKKYQCIVQDVLSRLPSRKRPEVSLADDEYLSM